MNKEGKRTSDYNLCFTNQEALDYVSGRAAEFAGYFKSTTGRYHFWIDDVADPGCYCPECQKLTVSDMAALAYNAILRGIRRTDKNGRQSYLAYTGTEEPPKIVKPDEGIFLEYAPISRDPGSALDDPRSGKNAKYRAEIQKLMAVFGTKDAQALDYWMDNSLFSHWKKPPQKFSPRLDVIKQDAAFYKKCGFETITSFACFLGDEYRDLYHEDPDIEGYAAALE
jgi:hypothetical protein